jgi:hypothetical protein
LVASTLTLDPLRNLFPVDRNISRRFNANPNLASLDLDNLYDDIANNHQRFADTASENKHLERSLLWGVRRLYRAHSGHASIRS